MQKGKDLGLGVLLVTHDLGVVANYCDRVGIMKDGKLIELAPVVQFLKGPERPYSRELLDAARVRPALIESNEQVVGQAGCPIADLPGANTARPLRPLS